ncbi:hypothetical protein D3C76_1561960 [compost metagenome]
MLVTNNNTLISGCTAINCHGGLMVGQPSIGGFMSLSSVNRYLGDSKKSLEWQRKVMEEDI